MANEYIDNNNNIKIVEQAPLIGQLTDYELIVDEQDLTDSYVDFGDEIDMNGYNKLGIWLIADTNDSTGVTLNVLIKDEFGGTDEYDFDSFSLWNGTISDFKTYYSIDCETVNYIQLQSKATFVGATTGDLTIYINKSYR